VPSVSITLVARCCHVVAQRCYFRFCPDHAAPSHRCVPLKYRIHIHRREPNDNVPRKVARSFQASDYAAWRRRSFNCAAQCMLALWPAHLFSAPWFATPGTNVQEIRRTSWFSLAQIAPGPRVDWLETQNMGLRCASYDNIITLGLPVRLVSTSDQLACGSTHPPIGCLNFRPGRHLFLSPTKMNLLKLPAHDPWLHSVSSDSMSAR
jgi:hypothetical protein